MRVPPAGAGRAMGWAPGGQEPPPSGCAARSYVPPGMGFAMRCTTLSLWIIARVQGIVKKFIQEFAGWGGNMNIKGHKRPLGYRWVWASLPAAGTTTAPLPHSRGFVSPHRNRPITQAPRFKCPVSS